METGAIILLIAYFIPAAIALARRHHNFAAIGMLNVLLGWTAIGWIIALVWSLTSPAPHKEQEQ